MFCLRLSIVDYSCLNSCIKISSYKLVKLKSFVVFVSVIARRYATAKPRAGPSLGNNARQSGRYLQSGESRGEFGDQ